MLKIKTYFQRNRALALWFFLCFPYAVNGETLSGQIVRIADGDTLTLLDATNTQHKIRLSGIDAPEKAQAFGERSKQNLARLAFQKHATAECYKTDRYRRSICTVYVNGLDLGLSQLDAGFAWWYRKYAKEQPQKQRFSYEAAEVKASVDRLGLWQDENPVPPWEWRKAPR